MSGMADAIAQRAARAAEGSGAVDLGALKAGGKLPPRTAEEAQAEAERQLGMRCAFCDERIAVGFIFTRFEASPRGVGMARVACCTRDECDGAADARTTADVVEMREFVWLDEERAAKAETGAGDAEVAVAPD